MRALLAGVALLAALSSPAAGDERMTPILLGVQVPPVPFKGSDDATHLVYELWLTNFSSGDATVQQVQVLGDGKTIATLDADAITTRLQPAGRRDATDVLSAGGTSLLFVHVVLPDDKAVPQRIGHTVRAHVAAAPPGQREMTLSGAVVAVDRRPIVVIGPPLRGDRYVAADSCCDATRHTRAALPVNGGVQIAQRFAVDWEQLDDASRVYVGPREQPKSYTIYGKEALAVADAKVASVIDDLQEQTPGTFPTAIPITQADGNSIVLDLGNGRFALYAHLQPKSIKVKPGDQVTRGQPLALVGNSGNSVAPHLHFHVMDGPSPLASNGLPYAIDAYQVTGHAPSTAAFDTAEEKGTPLEFAPVEPPRAVDKALPLDQSIVRFAK
jgi:hypothetical protein